MVRQISISDFPASWQEAQSEKRSHDSSTYSTRFMLRLDDPSEPKRQQLIEPFEVIATLDTDGEFPNRLDSHAASA